MSCFFVGFGCKSDREREEKAKLVIEKSWQDLGKMSQAELLTLIAFVFLAFGWFFREPGFISGWGSLFPEPSFIADGVIGSVRKFSYIDHNIFFIFMKLFEIRIVRK